MIVQYPDTATYPGTPGEATFTDGIVQPASSVADITQIGRYEPSTLNREIPLKDGAAQKLKGIFYMPLNAPEVQTGMDFTVKNSAGENVLTTKVLFFTRGQLNCRVYL
jgi:hypothetical protein